MMSSPKESDQPPEDGDYIAIELRQDGTTQKLGVRFSDFVDEDCLVQAIRVLYATALHEMYAKKYHVHIQLNPAQVQWED